MGQKKTEAGRSGTHHGARHRGPRADARRGRGATHGTSRADGQEKGPLPAKKFQPSEIHSAKAAETSYIPTEGAEAHLGAMRYLAVLAYPKRTEWAKRDKFIEACSALFLKLCIKQTRNPLERRRLRLAVLAKCRKFRPRDIEGIMGKAARRIDHWRLPAATAAGWFGINGITVRNFPIPAATGEGKSIPMTLQISAPSRICAASRAISKLLQKRNRRGEFPWEPGHVWDRILRDSKPVLHLAMALPDDSETDDPESGAIDMIRLILKPKWLQGSLRNAEILRRGWLPRTYPNYKPENAISLLPSASPSMK